VQLKLPFRGVSGWDGERFSRWQGVLRLVGSRRAQVAARRGWLDLGASGRRIWPLFLLSWPGRGRVASVPVVFLRAQKAHDVIRDRVLNCR
jgi:hypothetical protein